MTICRACGVELEHDMKSCPLCNVPVSSREQLPSDLKTELAEIQPGESETRLMSKILLQIMVVLLLSGIVATFIINLSTEGSITWSIYPISICLIILAYVTSMSLWRIAFLIQLLAGWFISSLLFVAVNWYFEERWALFLAFPILSVINFVGIIFYFILTRTRKKSLNVLAMAFVSLAVVGIAIEMIISLYNLDKITLSWSVIVAACLLPATAVILFIYFRTKNNSDLQKIFHT